MQITLLTGINRNTVNRYLRLISDRIVLYCEEQRPLFGVVEVDESLFGAKRVNGKKGRGAYGKTTVFGIYERAGMVYPEIVPDCSKVTLQAIIRGKVGLESVINSDCWQGYNALDVSDFKHFRINHSELFADKDNHINGIENFWNQAKRHLRKFNGVPKDSFALFLKECEWRFNNPSPQAKLKMLKQWVKKFMG